MKKTLFFIPIILLIVSVSLAYSDFCSQESEINRKKSEGAATPSACTSCTPGDPADIMCEDFEGSNNPPNSSAWCSWSENIDSGNTVTTGSHTGTWDSCLATDLGSNAMQFTCDGDNGENCSIYRSISPNEINLKLYFWFDEDNTDVFDGNECGNIVRVDRAVGLIFDVRICDNGSNVNKVKFFYVHSGGTKQLTTSQVITDGQVYMLYVHWTRNTLNGAKIFIDDVDLSDSDGNTTVDAAPDTLALGGDGDSSTIGAGDAYSGEIDLVELDDDTEPGDCEQ